MLEKGTAHARTRHWYGAIDSEDMLAAGEAPVDRAALRRDLKRYSSGKINMNTFNTWINESAAMAKFVHEDFGKPAYRLSEIRKPPFYGFWLGACILTTEQGILINEKAQALDEDRKPIPGLFVTGDCTGGFFVNNYPCVLPGIAMGRTMTFAIKAVKVAMGEE